MSAEKILEFLLEAGKLKNLKRSGWVERGVKKPESVADHMFRTALMCLVLGASKQLDFNKTIKMALVHDLAESKVGDIMTWDKDHMATEEKLKKEKSAIIALTENLGPLGQEIKGLWVEFEENQTPEAKFVKQIDKIEMFLQAVEYMRAGNYKKPLDRFIDERNLRLIKDADLLQFLKTVPEIKDNLEEIQK